MKKRKLKGFVLPTLYLLITICVFTSIVLLGSTLRFDVKDYNYSTGVLKENVESVLVEDEITSSKIESPVDLEKVSISIHFYNKDDDEEKQKDSLIYYENTYLPNTGVIYTSDNEFEVKSIFSGKVTEILDDEIFGKYVVIEHSNNLRTYYYGLENVEVELEEEITTGTIIGMSKTNDIINNKKSFLLEAYYNNELINPETLIGTKITDYE